MTRTPVYTTIYRISVPVLAAKRALDRITGRGK